LSIDLSVGTIYEQNLATLNPVSYSESMKITPSLLQIAAKHDITLLAAQICLFEQIGIERPLQHLSYICGIDL